MRDAMKEETVNIRPWQESDRPFLRTLYLHARKASWTWIRDEEWRLEDFDAATLNEQIWVAEVDGHRAGFASLQANDNFLHNLFVGPEFQGQGVGSALLEKVQAQFSSTGALKCLVENHAALGFYQRHGWVIEAKGASPEGEYWLMHYRV